jgi:hypothetical protein
MDTRFWGPSGWRLLHLITFAYEPENKKNIQELFKMLPFVLPCKYCRASLTEYMEQDNLNDALETRGDLTRWFWRIHNSVNKKLRQQNLAQTIQPDPPFEKVAEFYESILATGCSRTEFPGWDFLFSVAELHPFSKSAKESVPIPGMDCTTLKTNEDKNRWNCLSPKERMPLYKKFWQSLANVLPFPEWRKSWKKHSKKINESTKYVLDTRSSTIRWLWQIRCKMEKDLNLLNSCKYKNLCKTLKTHRSGCSKSLRAKTCRKKRNIK